MTIFTLTILFWIENGLNVDVPWYVWMGLLISVVLSIVNELDGTK